MYDRFPGSLYDPGNFYGYTMRFSLVEEQGTIWYNP